jgi:hypothetical protein
MAHVFQSGHVADRLRADNIIANVSLLKAKPADCMRSLKCTMQDQEAGEKIVVLM